MKNHKNDIKDIIGAFSNAESYDSHYQKQNPTGYFFNTRAKLVLKLLGNGHNANDQNVLDIGCGPCKMYKPLSDKSFNYFGYDISKNMLLRCNKTNGFEHAKSLTLGSAESLPFNDNQFSAVLCMGIVEYVESPLIVLDEINRILKPGGIVIISLINKFSPYRIWEKYIYNTVKKIKNNYSGIGPKHILNVSMFSPGVFKKQLIKKGFEPKEVVYFDYNLLPSPIDRNYPAKAVKLNKKLSVLALTWFKFMGTAFIIVAKKA
jgi:ubiquinone/menaquinone biosynthesis C-methylase UbiE